MVPSPGTLLRCPWKSALCSQALSPPLFPHPLWLFPGPRSTFLKAQGGKKPKPRPAKPAPQGPEAGHSPNGNTFPCPSLSLQKGNTYKQMRWDGGWDRLGKGQAGTRRGLFLIATQRGGILLPYLQSQVQSQHPLQHLPQAPKDLSLPGQTLKSLLLMHILNHIHPWRPHLLISHKHPIH